MSLFKRSMKQLFREPIVVLVLGDWRTGKTDVSLLIAYLLKNWNTIQKIASNIWTFNSEEVEYVYDLALIRKWLHADRSEKLYLLDEALKHAYRRKAMSTMNIDIITEILPELSKGHARLIVCSQIEKLDTDLLHPAFCRATFVKLNKKTMKCYAPKYWKRARTFYNLPKSPIPFDKDRIAKLIDTKMSKMSKTPSKGRLYEIARLRLEGHSVSEIRDKFALHPEQYRREISKVLKWFVGYVDSLEEPRDFVNSLEMASLDEKSQNSRVT